jgi:UDP-N-acetylglucosamine 2-epimerase (non-hydrolysing)
MKNCELIITDSGGIQEEATAPSLRKPVLVTRLSTERPEAVEAGFARVVGVEEKYILEGIEQTLKKKDMLPQMSPYGDGRAAAKIVRVLEEEVSVAS